MKDNHIILLCLGFLCMPDTMSIQYKFVFFQRVFDTIPSIGIPLSDHYGVKIRLSNIRQNCNSFKESLFHCVSEIKELAPLQIDYSEVCFD